MMINWLIDEEVPFIVVATKTDKLSKTALKETLLKIKNDFFLGTNIEILPFSSVTRDGRDLLWSKIFDAIG
jgi:GTP-binding protein